MKKLITLLCLLTWSYAGNGQCLNVVIQNSGAIMMSTGESGEWIFKLEDTLSTASITNITVDFTGALSTIDILSYQLNTIDSLGTCNSSCTSFSDTILHLDSINLTSGTPKYLHVCFKGKCLPHSSTSYSGGNVVFTVTDSGSCNVVISVPSNITVNADGTPKIDVTIPRNYAISGDMLENGTQYNLENSSYDGCSSNNMHTRMYFKYKNIGNSISIGSIGYGKATKLELFFNAADELGTINPNSFKVARAMSNHFVSLPSGAGTSYVVNTNAHHITSSSMVNYTSYVINFNNWLSTDTAYGLTPIGIGTLADIDNDGHIDDLNEGDSLVISLDFKYNPSCPWYFTSAYTGSIDKELFVSTQTQYQNQCENLLSTSDEHYEHDTLFYPPLGTGGWVDASYRYMDKEITSTISVPNDVDVAVTPDLKVTLCPNFTQEWGPGNYDFQCPNGFHRVYMPLPAGYHLDLSSAILFNTSSGTNYRTGYFIDTVIAQYSLIPDTVKVTDSIGTCGHPDFLNIDFGRIHLNESTTSNYTAQLSCFKIPLTLTCSCNPPGDTVISALTNGPDQFRYELQYICCEDNCRDVLAKATAKTVNRQPKLDKMYS